jgi:hypothetical protein
MKQNFMPHSPLEQQKFQSLKVNHIKFQKSQLQFKNTYTSSQLKLIIGKNTKPNIAKKLKKERVQKGCFRMSQKGYRMRHSSNIESERSTT